MRWKTHHKRGLLRLHSTDYKYVYAKDDDDGEDVEDDDDDDENTQYLY